MTNQQQEDAKPTIINALEKYSIHLGAPVTVQIDKHTIEVRRDFAASEVISLWQKVSKIYDKINEASNEATADILAQLYTATLKEITAPGTSAATIKNLVTFLNNDLPITVATDVFKQITGAAGLNGDAGGFLSFLALPTP